MSLQDELVSELVSSGLNQYQLTLLLKLVSAMSTRMSGGSRVESPDAQVERRREWDRNYRRKRRLAVRATSTACPPDKVDAAPILSSFLSSENEEGKGTSEKVRKKEKTSGCARGTRLTPEVKLSLTDLDFALSQGLTEAEARDGWVEFLDYWVTIPGQRGVKLDWSATWRNNVRRMVKFKAGKPNAKAGNVIDAADRLKARIADFDRPPPSERELCGGADAPNVRLLPQGGRE